jgi:hypothetical protein
MRVQVYHEELGSTVSLEPDVEVIHQVSRNGEKFYGLRVWLKTCRELLDHSTPEDDDRSAVTFWAPSIADLMVLVSKMGAAVHHAQHRGLGARCPRPNARAHRGRPRARPAGSIASRFTR